MSILANTGTFSIHRTSAPSPHRHCNDLRATSLRSALLYFTAVLCIATATATAQAQQGYSVSIGAATHYVTENDSRSDCDGTTNSSSGGAFAGDVLSTLDLRPELKLFKYASGEWKSASVTVYVPETPETGFTGGNTYISSISSAGIVTTNTSGAISGNSISLVEETATDSSIETLDLNTGMYTWHRVINESYPGGTCPFTAVDKQDRTATLSIQLYPSNTSGPALYFVNPAASHLGVFPLPAVVDASTVAASPQARGLVADGSSALVVAYHSNSSSSVTFSLAGQELASGSSLGGYPIGSLTAYDPSFLTNGATTTPPLGTPVDSTSCNATTDAAGTSDCTFLALLWSPQTMPYSVADQNSLMPEDVGLTVTAKQVTASGAPGSISNIALLEPPPLVLVHGVWSSAAAAWPAFEDWLALNYPNQIFAADYGPTSYLSFKDPTNTKVLTQTIANALASYIGNGIAATKVDVIAHSMGGLLTRYYIESGPALTNYLPPNTVHSLFTIGTPHTGTEMAVTLWTNKDNNIGLTHLSPTLAAYCPIASACTLNSVLMALHKPIDTAVEDMQTGLGVPITGPITETYKSMAGDAPTTPPSFLELLFNSLIAGYAPSAGSVSVVLGRTGNTANDDALVTTASQLAYASDTTTIQGIVHADFCQALPGIARQYCSDVGETESPAFFKQSLYWLMGGSGFVPATSGSAAGQYLPNRVHPMNSDSSTAPSPILDLTGYTQVASSTAVISPASGSTLVANSTATIAVTASKAISEVLLFQLATDPTDPLVLYATQSPFSIFYTPTRLGNATFNAFVVFTDNTYAETKIQYTLSPIGSPIGLQLTNAPTASMVVGSSTTATAQADFTNGYLDVTSAAVYSTQSGTSNVFSVAAGGVLQAMGPGVDTLNVSYKGFSASAQIAVGSCAFSLAPINQIVSFGGGTATVNVTAPQGCGWTATGDGATWVSFANASGSGNGTITLQVAANSSGSTRTSFITLAGQDIAITEPATACTYALTPSSISVPAGGGNGTISVSTSCPISSSSDSSWAAVTTLASSVAYTVDPNTSQSARTATLTIGTAQLSLIEAGASSPSLGINPSSISFGNQLLGNSSAPMVSTVSNSGTGPLTIAGVGLTGTDAAEFVITNTCGSSVAAGANCTVSVAFKPTYAGAATANVSIADNAAGSPQLIALSGVGVSMATPVITWPTPAAIAYGTVLGASQLDATASTPGSFIYNPAAGTVLGAGAQSLSVSFTPTDSTDYTNATATVSLTVNKAAPTLTWVTPTAITYGTALSSAQLDASASTAGTFAYSPGAGIVLMAGTQKLSSSFAPTDATDYSSVSGNATLIVNPAALTVTASNASRVFGTANPAFTASISGAVNNDVLSPAATSVATISSAVGSYPIMPTATGTNIASYAVTPVNGTLTVAQAGSTTTVATSAPSAVVGTSVTLTATVASATTGTPTGSVQFLNGTSVLGSVQLSGGTASYAVTSLGIGSDSITASYAGDTNFKASQSTPLIETITGVPSFSVTSNPTTLSIKQGQTGTISFTVTPANGFNQAITFSCGALPAEATCAFAPTSVTPNGAPVADVLTISTTAPTYSMIDREDDHRSIFARGKAGIVSFALLFGLLPFSSRHRFRTASRLCLLVAAVSILAISGCGSSPSSPTVTNAGTPVGSSQVVITGTSGSGTGSTQSSLTLTVNITN